MNQFDINNIDKMKDKDWKRISRNENLSEYFIEKYWNKLNHDDICRFSRLSNDFLEKHFNDLNLLKIASNQVLSEVFIEKHFDILDNKIIIINQKLSENFIEKHFKILKENINLILEYHRVSIKFIKKHEKFIDKIDVLKFQPLSENDFYLYKTVFWKAGFIKYQIMKEEFIEKNIDDINLKLIIKYQILSDKFIIKLNDELNWDDLSFYQPLSENIIRKFKDKINFKTLLQKQRLSTELKKEIGIEVVKTFDFNNLNDIDEFLKDNKVSEEFIENNCKEFSKDKFTEMIFYQDVSEKFIENNLDKINFGHLMYRIKFSEDFLERNKLKIIKNNEFGNEFMNLSMSQKLSENFIEKHKDNLKFIWFAKYQELSEEFIIKYWDKLNKKDVLENQELSEEFIIKHIDEIEYESIVKLFENGVYTNELKLKVLKKNIYLYDKIGKLDSMILFSINIMYKELFSFIESNTNILKNNKELQKELQIIKRYSLKLKEKDNNKMINKINKLSLEEMNEYFTRKIIVKNKIKDESNKNDIEEYGIIF